MEFKKLELSGFKSFFDKTNFFIEVVLLELLGQTVVVNLIL